MNARRHVAILCGAIALVVAACASPGPSTTSPTTTSSTTVTTAVPTTAAPTTAAPTTAAPTTAAPTTATSTTAAPATTSPTTATTSAPTTTLPTDVASLPAGNGAVLAVVIDDLADTATYLDDYLRLPIPLTFAVLPMSVRAPAAAAAVAAANRQVILHIPLPVAPSRTAPGGLALDASDADVAAYLDTALARVPAAAGANNHQGSWGTATPVLMSRLLRGLQQRSLFFLDSVTSQHTVGYATARSLGMQLRINNVFLDNNERSPRPQLLALARLAASHGTAIGIGHVTRPWLLHALQTMTADLEARGYRFAFLSAVTNGPAGGLDTGVLTSLPTH